MENAGGGDSGTCLSTLDPLSCPWDLDCHFSGWFGVH